MTLLERAIRALGFTPVWNANEWKRKWSTWIAALQAALGAAVLAWTQLPPELRAEIPREAVAVVSGLTVLLGFLSPLITNALQPKLQSPKLPD